MILLTSTRQMLCTFGFSFICVVLLLFICVADLAHFVVLTLLCLFCCAYFVVLTLFSSLSLLYCCAYFVVLTFLVVLVCLLCCACFVFLTLLAVSLCLLWCAYFVVLCYAYFVFLSCFCLLCLLCLLACFRFASLGCRCFISRMKIVLTSTSALHCFTWIIGRGFAEHHGRKKYVSGKYTYALRRTHERQSPATIYKYQGLSTLINANRSWFDSKITLDFPLKNDACVCAKRTFSRQFGVRCYNVYCPCSCTLPCPALAYSLQLTVLASVTRPYIEPIRVYPT